MNRRSFFARTFGAVAVAAFAPVLRLVRPRPTVGAINQATFKFWRNQIVVDNQCPPNTVYFLSSEGLYRLNGSQAEIEKLFQDCR